jgi:hypothetical protein
MIRKPTKTFVFALLAVAGFAILGTVWDASVSASSDRVRRLRVTKECGDYKPEAGSFCTITASSLRQITRGSIVFYTQPPDVPVGLLDSNVVLDAGKGNRAVGRCTLELATGLGLCTFSDGTGDFAGFNARVNVTALDPEGLNWLWEGTYSFDSRD